MDGVSSGGVYPAAGVTWAHDPSPDSTIPINAIVATLIAFAAVTITPPNTALLDATPHWYETAVTETHRLGTSGVNVWLD
jgi:hypothetical protein